MLSSQELLADLTAPQREAASHVDGPLLIIAGAGSGKTRVLTRRVAYLISQGIEPGSILAITFTNKAAGEMKERVGRIMSRPLRDIGRLDQWFPTICTFHSLCMRILRTHGEQLGVPRNFTVYDSSDQKKLMKDVLKALEINSQNFTPAQLHGSISGLKNQLVTPEDCVANAGTFYDKILARVYGKYQAMLKANNALDFDDLLMTTVYGFRRHPDVLARLQERFQYVLIDEYQDTNKAQYVLAHSLAIGHKNICVVGDPDQSIYAWRGADIQNILDFEKDYAQAKVVRLEQNYRSTKTILGLADALIRRNTRRKEKQLFTENEQGVKATYFVCQTETDEADTIVEQLRNIHENADRPWSEMAIFYRMNSLSRVLEEKLMAARIPYQVARGVEFYNRKEIKDVLSYLRVLVNPNDEVALTRIINTPTRGISAETVRRLQLHGVAGGLTLWEAIEQADSIADLTTKARKSLSAFATVMRSLMVAVAADVPGESNTPAEDDSSILTEVDLKQEADERAAMAEEDGFDLSAMDMFSDFVPATPPPVESTADADDRAGDQAWQHLPHTEDNPSDGNGVVPFDLDDLLPSDRQQSIGKSSTFVHGGGLATSAVDGLDDADASDGETNNTTEFVGPKLRVQRIMEAVVERSGLKAVYDNSTDPDKPERANVAELINSAAAYDKEHPNGSLDDYLAQISLMSDIDKLKDGGGAVTLMTLHAAKGLEFPVVAMVGMEEGILPHSRARTDPAQHEEERRLCFVGITRAQQQLFFSRAFARTLMGRRERTIPSPFMKEMPADLIEVVDRTDLNFDQDESRDFEAGGSMFRHGQTVRHPTFGIGRIAEIHEMGRHTRAVVEFSRMGRKTLILEYAQLEPMS